MDGFIRRFDEDPQLAPVLGGVNAAAGARIRQHFVDFICARTGGPCLYNGRSMKEAHEGLPIGDAAFEAVMRHFDAALQTVKVGTSEKAELLSLFRALQPEIVTRKAG